MIFILNEEADISSDLVIEWLIKWDIPYINMNDTYNAIKQVNISSLDSDIIFKEGFSFSDITITWFRRGYFLFSNILSLSSSNEMIRKPINQHLMEETQTLKEYIYYLLKTKPSINHPLVYNASKLIVLQKAVENGLKIPPTLITNELAVVKKYKNKHQSIISKNIQDIISIPIDNQRVGHSTELVDNKSLSKANSNFFFSLFQKAIYKKYELRVFYFNGTCYSAAIFSQLGENSKNDTRLESKDKPNRVVPYKLPLKIEKNIQKLMTDLKMESGSLDFIVDEQLHFYFLEVNPVGQFDYISKRCNYYLEYEIANEFKRIYNEEKTTI